LFTNKLQLEQPLKSLLLKERKINFIVLLYSTSYHTQDYTTPTALVVGTEATGLTENGVAQPPKYYSMQGEIDSMNVSVAAAILIFEAKRQRGF
jgi:TrmH family RNA methyltransferase